MDESIDKSEIQPRCRNTTCDMSGVRKYPLTINKNEFLQQHGAVLVTDGNFASVCRLWKRHVG